MPMNRNFFAKMVFGLAVCAGSVLSAAELTAPWPQWRGPLRDGTVAGTDWPDKLADEHLEPIWKVALDSGYSGPIVAADRVFVTETVDKQTEKVTALDRATGKVLWTAAWPGALSVPFFAKANGDWIRATPAFDGETLYVAGIRDVVVALNAADGKERWRVDFPEQLKSAPPTFGFASSPLVHGDGLYVQAGGGFCKLDKATGKLVWRVLDDGGGMNGSAFASPYVATLNGVEQILVQTREKLCGIDPAGGKVLWEIAVEAFRGMNILTPTIEGNRIFTSTYGGGSFLIEVTQPSSEAPAAAKQLWRNKVQGYMSSPILKDGHAYLHLRNQRFACLDLATGEERWISQPHGMYWSLVAQGSKLLALDENGDLLLIRLTPEKFEVLDQRTLVENSWAHLAVAGNELYVRDLKGLTVYRWK
jgi:outer membrane protein assembly factor BamB